MRSKGATSVLLPIPLKNDITGPATQLVADTTYNQMRIHDVTVSLLDASGAPLGDCSNGVHESCPVQVQLTKSGVSWFFDSSMDLHVFTHAKIKFGNGDFIYDSNTGCPLSKGSCRALCADYIRYSPFGKWNVAVDQPTQQGVDLSKLASIRFAFQVDYGSTGKFSRNFFGKDPDVYPQNFGYAGVFGNCESLQEARQATLMHTQATKTATSDDHARLGLRGLLRMIGNVLRYFMRIFSGETPQATEKDEF